VELIERRESLKTLSAIFNVASSDFWKRIRKRMQVPKKRKVAAAGAALDTIADIPYFGLPARFGKAYKDELATMAQEEKIDEILEIVRKIDPKIIYKNLRIKVKDEDLKRFTDYLIPYLIKINSKLDALLEDHRRFDEKQIIMLLKMERIEAKMTELQNGLLKNPSIMKQISTYSMSPPEILKSSSLTAQKFSTALQI